MEVLLAVLGIIVTVILAVIPFLRKKFAERPRLEMVAKRNGGSSGSRGLSMLNEFIEGVVEMEKAIHVFQLKYRYQLTIFNNSDQTAYYPVLYFDARKYNIEVQELPPHPISNSTKIELRMELSMLEEKTGFERTDTSDFPAVLEGVHILLEYQNTHKTKFYTLVTLSKEGAMTDLNPSKTVVKSVLATSANSAQNGLLR
ncbi:MAG: hypothetical protein EOP48_22325 [Sphingobacteriales bacterium]|nr:MAG: hypothetical protein EOP48_22325 [Sphingobacteriales bacterium]